MFYVYYESEKLKHADGYETEDLAHEYAQEAIERGFVNVSVMNEEEYENSSFNQN